MQSVKVTYTNFFGEETEEKLHFHLSKGELMQMELQTPPALGQDRHGEWRRRFPDGCVQAPL